MHSRGKTNTRRMTQDRKQDHKAHALRMHIKEKHKSSNSAANLLTLVH
jgi:hypothetical protein